MRIDRLMLYSALRVGLTEQKKVRYLKKIDKNNNELVVLHIALACLTNYLFDFFLG